jgi:hypothetical protein
LIDAVHISSTKILADCWWQIPPIGKEFHHVFDPETGEIPEASVFSIYGTPVAWTEAG